MSCDDLNETQLLWGPDGMQVLVPIPPERPVVRRGQRPPSPPPVVFCFGELVDYWQVLRSGYVDRGSLGATPLTDEQMQWLREVEVTVLSTMNPQTTAASLTDTIRL